MIFITYKCTVCGRTKDIQQDNTRAFINQCIITKGCTGTLYKIGETSVATTTPLVEGLVDWTPRGTTIVPAAKDAVAENVDIISSSLGAITLATPEVLTANQLVMTLTQRLVTDTSVTDYLVQLASDTTIVSGKDSKGRIIRFDQAAIDSGRVTVFVNGVQREMGTTALDFQLLPNTVIFNSIVAAGSKVVINVFAAIQTRDHTLSLVRNTSLDSDTTAWSNVGYVLSLSNEGLTNLYTYTALSTSGLPNNAVFKLSSVTADGAPIPLTSTVILLATPPYENVDRVMSSTLKLSNLTGDFSLQTTGDTGTLQTSSDNISPVYPSYRLAPTVGSVAGSLINAERTPTSTSTSQEVDYPSYVIS